MKILLATAPYETNVRNLAGLAVYLKDQGAEINWYASNKYARFFDELGIGYFPYRLANDYNSRLPDEVCAARKPGEGNLGKIKSELIDLPVNQTLEYFLDLQAISKNFAFQVLVCDQEFTALPLVRQVMAVPVVAIGLVPLTESSADTYRTGLGKSPGRSIVDRIKRIVWNSFADHIVFGALLDRYRNVMKKHGIELAGTNVYDDLVKYADVFIQPGTSNFEFKRRIVGDNICFTGLLPERSAMINESWTDIRLTTYHKVVFVSLGLKGSRALEIVESVLQAFSGSDTLIVVDTGSYATRSLNQRYDHHNIIIREHIPLTDVLPYCTALISDGDLTAVLTGLSYGVPVVSIGCDHWRNDVGARISYFKLGVHLKAETPSPDDVSEAVAQIQANPTYRQNCRNLAGQLLKDDGGKVIVGYIRALVTEKQTRISA